MSVNDAVATVLIDGSTIEYIGETRVCIGRRGNGFHDVRNIEDMIQRALIPLIKEVNTLKNIAELAREVIDSGSDEGCDGLYVTDGEDFEKLETALTEAKII